MWASHLAGHDMVVPTNDRSTWPARDVLSIDFTREAKELNILDSDKRIFCL
jgi:hypothetical protein